MLKAGRVHTPRFRALAADPDEVPARIAVPTQAQQCLAAPALTAFRWSQGIQDFHPRAVTSVRKISNIQANQDQLRKSLEPLGNI